MVSEETEPFWIRTWKKFSEAFGETIETKAEIHDKGVMLSQGYLDQPADDIVGIGHNEVIEMANEIQRLREDGVLE